jgi:hypothetical protein
MEELERLAAVEGLKVTAAILVVRVWGAKRNHFHQKI